MAHTNTWNSAYEASPADGDNVSDGAGKIRGTRQDVRERIAKDHYMDIAGTDADHGEHSKVTFQAPISKPSSVANKGFLYGKDVSSKIELHFEDEDGNEIQMTAGGALSTAAGFSDGTNAITFPTNGMAAAKTMLGDSNTIAWFYLNTAPPGWKALSTGGDTVLGVSGGSGDYNVNGGNPDSAATWTIDGLTAANESSHTHTYSGTTSTVTTEFGNQMAGVNDGIDEHSHTYSGTTSGGSTHTHAISQDASWRPSASVGKLFQLDTA